MQQRPIRTTGLTVSEVGFGAWTIAAGGCSEAAATAMLRAALDAGITLFATGNVFGTDGSGEQLVGRALADARDRVTLATTFGYDTATPWTGVAGHAQDWSADAVRRSLERSLQNLGTDAIDLWQLHHPRMDAMRDDALWELLYHLRSQGMVKAIGPALAAGVDGRDAGLFAIEHRDIDFVQHVHTMLDQDPGNELTDAATERDIALLAQVPSAPVPGAVGDAAKVDALQFLVDAREDATFGQVALKWLLSDPGVASVLPDIHTLQQVAELAAAPDVDEFDADELGEVDMLYRANFGIDREPAGV